MKKKMVLLFIMMSCFLVACSGQEHVGEDVYMTADESERELETTQEEMEAERPAFTSEKFVSDEAIYSAYLSRTPLEILCFGDMIFVKGDCYEYRDGYYYYLPEQGLEENVPEGNMKGFVTQTREFLIYLEKLHVDSGWTERVILVDPSTREQAGNINLGELLGEEEVQVYATHEEEFYYKINRDNEGDAVGRINCVDMSYETIFTAEEGIRNITVCEDGSLIVSALDLGWFRIDTQGQTSLMLEKIDGVWDEYVYWYGDAGYFSLIEYPLTTEILHLKEDGTYGRLYNMYGIDNPVYLEDYFINIADDGTFHLYDYNYILPEEEPSQVYYTEKNHAFEMIQVIEDEIIYAGYMVEEYCICDDTIWLFLRNQQKDLIVRSWKVREREDLDYGWQVMKDDYSGHAYEIYNRKYKDGIRTNKDVTYPQIRGLEDVELEEKVNALLYEAAISSEVFENADYQQDITYKVMRADEDVLSVVFRESTINTPTTYTYYDNYAVTLDMHTGERMKLWDFIEMEAFDKQLLKGKFESDFSSADELEPEWVLTAYRYDLSVPLSVAEPENYKEETEHVTDFFVKDDGLGIIVEVGKYSVIFEMEFADSGYYMSEPNTILVRETTKKEIEGTILKMYECGYFERLEKRGFGK